MNDIDWKGIPYDIERRGNQVIVYLKEMPALTIEAADSRSANAIEDHWDALLATSSQAYEYYLDEN